MKFMINTAFEFKEYAAVSAITGGSDFRKSSFCIRISINVQNRQIVAILNAERGFFV